MASASRAKRVGAGRARCMLGARLADATEAWHRCRVIALPDALSLRDGDVALRDWRDGDQAALTPLFGDPDVGRFYSLPTLCSRAAALEYVGRLRAKRAAGELLALAVHATAAVCGAT
jgi:hypothetical protein